MSYKENRIKYLNSVKIKSLNLYLIAIQCLYVPHHRGNKLAYYFLFLSCEPLDSGESLQSFVAAREAGILGV